MNIHHFPVVFFIHTGQHLSPACLRHTVRFTGSHTCFSTIEIQNWNVGEMLLSLRGFFHATALTAFWLTLSCAHFWLEWMNLHHFFVKICKLIGFLKTIVTYLSPYYIWLLCSQFHMVFANCAIFAVDDGIVLSAKFHQMLGMSWVRLSWVRDCSLWLSWCHYKSWSENCVGVLFLALPDLYAPPAPPARRGRFWRGRGLARAIFLRLARARAAIARAARADYRNLKYFHAFFAQNSCIYEIKPATTIKMLT